MRATKKILHFDPDVDFPVEDEAVSHAGQVAERGKALHAEWEASFAKWASANAERKELFDRMAVHRLPDGWTKKLPSFPPDAKGMATRKASGNILNAIGPVLPKLWGGQPTSRRATSPRSRASPRSFLKNIRRPMWPGNRYGRILHFGIREHGMGAILNGIALSGGTRPFGGTFLVFSDYMRPSVRLGPR